MMKLLSSDDVAASGLLPLEGGDRLILSLYMPYTTLKEKEEATPD
ncbi:hypothetical protein [Anabaena sp. UHCC 0399]|nr:hypothetical protein [Anabaena sp. UHCC 0399]MEA5569358.1 hypothetical protein [Anabaena sp. UHCC 0399]